MIKTVRALAEDFRCILRDLYRSYILHLLLILILWMVAMSLDFHFSKG
jgi:hypothetical protein